MTAYRIAETAFDPNGLLMQPVTFFIRPVTIVSGQNLVAGAVLGQITTGGKYALSVAAETDGSQDPVAILMEAANASGGDVTARAAFTGAFDRTKLTFGAGWTAAIAERRLAQRTIQLLPVQPVAA